MHTFVADSQAVAETEGVLFESLQSGAVDFAFIVQNVGVNTVNYRFQEYNGTAWANMDVQGTDLYNTLSPDQVKSFKVESDYPRVRLVGNASGGSTIEFSLARFFNRSSGGALPLMAA